jgi:hypothetical protein
MATAKNKTISQVESAPVDPVAIGTEINLEDAIADQLLDSIDWRKVRAALLKKAPAKLFAWLVSGNDTPVNISAYPELAALPSADGEEKAA